MAVLVDCSQKATRLLQHANAVQGAYDAARDAYDRLENGQPLDTNWMTLSINIGDQQIPLPLPQDRAVLQAYFLEGINFLAGQLDQIWAELHHTTGAAVSHIEQAAARAEASSVIQDPPSIAPFPQPAPQQAPLQPAPFYPTPPATTGPPAVRATPPATPPLPQVQPTSIQLPPANGPRIPTVAIQ